MLSMTLTDDQPPDISGSVEMKTKLGWSLRWCEFKGKTCQFIRSHDREDRTTRKLSDLKRARLRLEPGHSSDRYIEVVHASSQEAGVHTLRLRLQSAREAGVWIQTVQKAQNYLIRSQETRKIFTVRRKTEGGPVGLRLRKAFIESVDSNSPAAAAGLVTGLQITRVGDTLITAGDEKQTANCVSTAPREFEIEVKIPKETPEKPEDAASLHTLKQLRVIGMLRKRKTGEFLPDSLLKGLIPWVNHNLKIMVVLWGWGNTVESRHISVPGAFVTAKKVHQYLDSDSTWQGAREQDSSWDSKAVYFAGPSAGPSAGRQQRVMPGESLLDTGFHSGKGLALHVVSVASKKHLSDFSTSAQSDDEGAGPAVPSRSGKMMSVAEHERIMNKKKHEIKRLKDKINELQKALQQATGGAPWDEEEEPPVVADLRDKVDAATTLDELESLYLPEEEAGFFTPAGTPQNSDHWGGVDLSLLERTSPLDLDALSMASASEWVGPEEAPRAGNGHVDMQPKGSIEEMGPNTCSEGWAEGWNLRNIGYKKTGEKIPSLDSIYHLVGVDLWKSPDPVQNIGSRLKLPMVEFNTNGLPSHVVFNLQLPFCEAPSVWGSSNGPVANVVVTFGLKKATAENWEDIPAAKLLKEYYEKVPEKGASGGSNPFLGRFKILVRAEKGVPKAFSRYNGKPVLITRSGVVHRSDRHLQIDSNLRCWAYPARVALYSMWTAIPQFKLHVGCCIESRDDKEMPERILGCAQVSNLQLDEAPAWPGDCTDK